MCAFGLWHRAIFLSVVASPLGAYWLNSDRPKGYRRLPLETECRAAGAVSPGALAITLAGLGKRYSASQALNDCSLKLGQGGNHRLHTVESGAYW